MRFVKSPLILFMSHAVALAAGWFIFKTPEGDTQRSAAAKRTAPHNRVTRIDPRKQRAEENQRIMEDITAKWKDQIEPYAHLSDNPHSGRKRMNELRQQQNEREEMEYDEIHKMSLTIGLPADPGALLDGMPLHSLQPEEMRRIPATMMAWMNKDPAAALKYLSTLSPEKEGMCANGIRAWVKHTDVEKALAALEPEPRFLASYGVMAINRAVRQDPTKLGGLLEQMDGKLDRSTILRGAFTDLPAHSRPAALDWIRSNLKGREAGDSMMHMAINISQSDEATAKAMLKGLVESDPALLPLFKNWGNYGDIMRSGVDKNSPLEERMAAALESNISGKTEEEKRANAMRMIASQDISEWFREGGWHEDLRNGTITVAEAWATVEKDLPQLAAANRSALLESLFAEISMIDPKAALDLVKQQGESAKLAEYVRQTVERNSFSRVEQAVTLAGSLPDEVIRPQLGAYDKTYRNLVAMNAGKGGPFWTNWVKSQPEGLSRDLLLHYTARTYFKNGNEAEGAALKTMVRDTTVKSWPKL